jgi:hypothetical protein
MIVMNKIKNHSFGMAPSAFSILLAFVLSSCVVPVEEDKKPSPRPNPTPFEDDDSLAIYVLADSAPEIWMWIEDGPSISELEGHSYPGPKMSLSWDGYYVAEVPAEYLPLSGSLRVKIDGSSGPSGTLEQTSWHNGLTWVTEDPRQTGVFEPYIGPYLTLLESSPGPDDKIIPVSLNPEENVIINWELPGFPADYIPGVEYREAGSGAWNFVQEDSFAAGKLLEISPWGKIFRTTLTGLEAGTSYEYRLVGPFDRHSETYSFSTPDFALDQTSFLVVGDMQDNGNSQRWEDVAQAISSNHLEDFDFMVTVGDMVMDDLAQGEERYYYWKIFFDKGKELFASKVIYPAMGNHDTPANPNTDNVTYTVNPQDTHSFRKYFGIDQDMDNPDYYFYEWGDATFFSVNSEIPAFAAKFPGVLDPQIVMDQNDWLEQNLNASSSQWNFAYFHIPPINPVGRKDEVPALRPLVDSFNGKLDWCITGHVHQYQRTKPLTATADTITIRSRYGRGTEEGVGYIVAPPSGNHPRYYTPEDEDILAFFPESQNNEPAKEVGFSLFKIDGKSLTMETYGLGTVGSQDQPWGYFRQNNNRDSFLIDRVTYSKNGITAEAGPDQSITLGQSLSLDGSASTSTGEPITQYLWKNSNGNISPSWTPNQSGTFAIKLEALDAQGVGDDDSLYVTVTDPDASFNSDFTQVDFRGDLNGWGLTPMSLTGDFTWTIEVYVNEENVNSQFKFYTSGRWYGDDERDGETHSDEEVNIYLPSEPGFYRITLFDADRLYEILKL